MTNDASDTFAKALRRQRELLGFSATELGRRVGKTQSYISQLENGALGVPDDERIEDIARAMEIESDLLFRAAGRLPPRVRKVAFESWVTEPKKTEDYLRETATGSAGFQLGSRFTKPNDQTEE